MNDRIYRSREERLFLGVLGGFAVRFGIDPSILRVAYAILTLLTGIFPLVIVYFVMAIVIPESPPGWEAAMRAAGPAAAPPPDWMQPREPGTPPATPSTGDVAAGGTAGAWPTAGAAGQAAGPAWGAVGAAVTADAGATAPAWGAADAGGAAGAGGTGPAWGTAGAAGASVDASTAHDSRMGAIVGGLVLVGLGAAFLLAQVAPDVDWGIVGPVLLIVLGIVLVLASLRRA